LITEKKQKTKMATKVKTKGKKKKTSMVLRELKLKGKW